MKGIMYPKDMVKNWNPPRETISQYVKPEKFLSIYQKTLQDFKDKYHPEDDQANMVITNPHIYYFKRFERMDNFLKKVNPDQKYWLTLEKERESKSGSNQGQASQTY